MPIRPLNSKVVVVASAEEAFSSGGIILPDAAKKKPFEGEVFAVGKGRTLEDGTVVPLSVKAGDIVVYSKYGGTEVTVEGKEYVILDEDQIYAIKE